MFRNYLANSKEEENATENWSYPAGYERFNSANIPRSRLGKRRTINPSAEIKRSILNGVSSENQSDRGDLNNFGSKTSSLTHPVNSFLTPNYKKTDNGLERNRDGNIETRALDLNVGNSFRNAGSYPLQEVNNIIYDHNKISYAGKLSNTSGPINHDSQHSDVQITLNKSYEPDKGQRNTLNFSSEECTQHYPLSSNNGTVVSDSSQSEVCNNSSFMTAHDYNFEKNQSHHHDYLKTPGKGYGLFDMVASPLGSLSANDDDNDSLRKFLVKTPALGRYDPLNTPYRSQIKHDLFTPFKSKLHTPINAKQLNNLAEKDIDSERPEGSNQECLLRLEDSLRTDCSINTEKKICPSSNNEEIETLASGAGINSTPLPIIDDCKRKTISEGNKEPPSVEKLVKRQIFEGLGWTLPHSSFAIQSPIKDRSSTVGKKNVDPKNDLLPTIKTEFKPMFDILNQQLPVSKTSTDFLLLSKSLDNRTDNQSEDSKSISSSEQKTIYNNEEGLFDVEDVTMRSPSSIEESKNLSIHNNVNNACKSNDCSNEPCKTNFYESDLNTPCVKRSSSTDDTKQSLSKHENECTVIEVPKNEKMESNETVILKQPSPPKLSDKKPSTEGLNNRKSEPKNKPECFADNPLFACQRQIMRSPQANITVNEKPYTVLSMLGRGGSSEVYLVLDPLSSKLMALKVVNLSSVEDAVAKGYLNEIEVLSKLQGCPSVIKMFDNEYISESKILYVLMEKGDTDFSRLMKDITKTKKISMSMITYYWTEMLNAVKDIHDKGIIHSDLKPANFLLVSGRLKLIDFGIASSLQGDMTSVLKDVTTGTFNYMSPEAIRNSGETRGYKINYKSDIWSLGCILYNLLYGRTPFSHLTNTWTKLQAIADPESAVSFPSDSAAPPHLLLSVRWALTKDPKDRPTAEELLRLAEFTPGPETQLGRQISALLGEYLSQMFPNCRVRLENPKDKKNTK